MKLPIMKVLMLAMRSYRCGLLGSRINLFKCVRRLYSKHSVSLRGASDSQIVFETGHVARFASGAVVVSQGDNAVSSSDPELIR